jgi:N-glycosylase/DNA lyase
MIFTPWTGDGSSLSLNLSSATAFSGDAAAYEFRSLPEKTMNRGTREKQLLDLQSLHASKRDAIRKRLDEFRQVPPSTYFYEIAYCLLTPQTSAENAAKVIAELQRRTFHLQDIDPVGILGDRSMYIRFHATKSNHLLRLKREFNLIFTKLSETSDAFEVREWLVRNVKGLGYKEATHFLRNIGRNGGLAILDRHILRNLQRYGAISSIPATLTRKHYLRIEHRFEKFAAQIGIPIDELDLLFWSMETGVIRK